MNSDPKDQDTRKLQGEGDYEAARRYNQATREHAQTADVEAEARAAAPQDDVEAAELEDAEADGQARAAEEDPLLDQPEKIDPDRA